LRYTAIEGNVLYEQQVVESFHLALLAVLGERGGRDAFVLKGGASLRFFLKSLRYSEDIDIDVPAMESWLFTERIAKAVGSELLARLLGLLGTTVETGYRKDYSSTKEKWSFELRHADVTVPVWTRLEVSYREYQYARESWETDRPTAGVMAPYSRALRAPLITHYLAPAAISQKIHALWDREETRSRDVFDLDLLLRGWQERPTDVTEVDLKAAIECAIGVGYEAYLSEVVTYLEESVASSWEEKAVWDHLRAFVVDELARLLP
jgi:hypothetical protein